jgi:hypothetical protein
MSIPQTPRESSGKAAGIIRLAPVGILLAVPLLFAVWKVYSVSWPSHQDKENLRRMALGMIEGAKANGDRLPERAAITDDNGKALLSWRVAILPYIGQGSLFGRFHLDEAWDSPHNKALLTPMPKVYSHPKDPEAAKQGLTPYRLFVGPETAFELPNPRYPSSIPDGTHNTILLVEAADAVPWTKPEELVYDPDGPLPWLGGRFHGGFNVAMWDSTVSFIDTKKVGEQELRKLITAAGEGALVHPEW